MRDENVEGRVLEVLDRLGVPYERIPCDPDLADTASFCQHYGYPESHSGNTILVASKKEPRVYAACVVRASARLDVNRKVRQLLGGPKLSFASPEETTAVTGQLIGGVTPFALPAGLPLYVDEGLMPLDYVILGAGSRSAKIKIAPEVFRRLPGAEIVSGLALERP